MAERQPFINRREPPSPIRAGAYSRSAASSSAHTPVSGGTHEYGPYSHIRKRSLGQEDHSSFSGQSRSSASERYAAVGAGAAWAGPTGYSKEFEPDDAMHDPRNVDGGRWKMDCRGFLNILTLAVIGLALFLLFAGYPILSHFLGTKASNEGGFGLGGTNGTGQLPSIANFRGFVDKDTPQDAKTWTDPQGTGSYHLVFSDEFEQVGRTFWPGDDPYWEAVDIWYGATGDLEWYSPEAVNVTRHPDGDKGALTITMTQGNYHNLNFQSGMIQSWNKTCFQGGYIEFSAIQPGSPTRSGYWPGLWTMGNLGRPGYLASTEGMWPYSYSACDTGIRKGQTNAQGGPRGAVASTGQYADNGKLSSLPGMKTPSCTCPGEDHPGPNPKVARAAPELDVLEAQIQTKNGVKHSFASQSLQTAPFDDAYFWRNTTPAITIHGDLTEINTYVGGPYQEAVSAVSQIPDRGFEETQNTWVTYGMLYEPDWDLNGGGFVTWYVDGKPTWTVTGDALPVRPNMEIDRRHVPVEPMTIIMNLGMAQQFQHVDFTDGGVVFPAHFYIDYVRVYQKDGQEDRISCDPPDYPTAKYIAEHPEPYMNPNLTQWKDTKYAWPKNSLVDGC